jgi:hypothetical protein
VRKNDRERLYGRLGPNLNVGPESVAVPNSLRTAAMQS